MDKGGWVVDQQFMDQMGSPYLMAHGMGEPVQDAFTTINVLAAGEYTVWVRTYNWTSPWTTKQGPGKFKVTIDGKTMAATLGCTGNKWEWQKAGKIKLKEGGTRISLKDLTGFNGRCDAIYLTTDDIDLPEEGEELAVIRRSERGLDKIEPERKSYDFVVVGGGIAGMCAAVAAARGGAKVALVNDRPVLGGNNSSEIRVHLGGYSELGKYPTLGKMLREFGHSRKGNAQPAEYYEDAKKDSFIQAEPLVTLYPSYRAVAVTKKGNSISSIKIENIESGNEIILKAPIYSDCTGDGTIGYLAGADYLMGREGRDEYGEDIAPVKGDELTMGSSVQWNSKEVSKAKSFPMFEYGVEFNDSTCENVVKGDWQWETGMNRDQIAEGERIRDYGLMVIYSNWSFLKNRAKDRSKVANRELDWVAYIAGRRESRRLLGDYILKQDDIDKNVAHEDASFTTSWTIDLHFPDSVNTKRFPGEEFLAETNHIKIYPYSVPYRCLYSRNVDNLFMAGRDISCTHVALGTVRVMRTTGMMGEVVGMAAGLCKKHGVTPRDIYRYHLVELKNLMQKGAATDRPLPDNQKFNRGKKFLPQPRAFSSKE